MRLLRFLQKMAEITKRRINAPAAAMPAMAGVDRPPLEEEASSGMAVEVGETEEEEEEEEEARLEVVVRGLAEVVVGRAAVVVGLGLAVVVVSMMMCGYDVWL